MRWYRKIIEAPEGDFTALGDALIWFENEHDDGKKILKVKGKITKIATELPAWIEYYYGLWMEVEAISKYMEAKVDRATQVARKAYLEHYNRALSDATADKYAKAEPEVLDLRLLLNHVLLIRNQLNGLHSGFNTLHFQLTNVVKLHAAGIEDAEL